MTNHATYRTATPADVPALVRLINSAYRVEVFFLHGDRTSAPDVVAKLEAPASDFLVIDDSGGLAGAVHVEVRGERGYFALLSVDPSHQGRGLGRVLVEAAEAHCRAAGCRALDIDVVNLRTELPPFYAKFGFRPTGVTPFPAQSKLKQPVHLVVMSKPLG